MPIGLLPSPDKLGPSPTEEFRRQRSGKGSKLQEGEEVQAAQKRGVEAENGGAAQDLIAAFIAADTVLPSSPPRHQLPPPPAAAAAADAPSAGSSTQTAAGAADPLADKGPSCSSAAAEVQAVCMDALLAAAEAAAGSEIVPAPTTAPAPASTTAASPAASPPQGASACRNLDFVRSPAVLEVHPDSSTPAVAVPPSPPAPPAPAVYATALAQGRPVGAPANAASFKKTLSKRWSRSMKSLRRAGDSLRRHLHRDSPPVPAARRSLTPPGSPVSATPHLPRIEEVGAPAGAAAAVPEAAAAAAAEAGMAAEGASVATTTAGTAAVAPAGGMAGSMEEVDLGAAAAPAPTPRSTRFASCACFTGGLVH